MQWELMRTNETGRSIVEERGAKLIGRGEVVE